MGKKWKKLVAAATARLSYSMIYGSMRLVGALPFRGLYALSNGLAWLAGTAVGYRRRVVTENLSRSFPEKSEAEIREIADGFYHWLADYFLETCKLSVMSRKGIEERMLFEGMDDVCARLRAGTPVVLYLGHYGNWEWISSIPLHMPPGTVGGQIYHPLENAGADRAFLKIRGRFGAHSIPMDSTLRVLLGWKRDGLVSATGFIADQAPGLDNTHLWVDFLNHDTPVFTGPERLARKLRAAVYYCDVTRPERGRYRCRFVEMSADAAKEEEFALTRQYFGLLEESIRRHPEMWLWSHRRWKRTREQFNRQFGAEGASRLRHLSRLRD